MKHIKYTNFIQIILKIILQIVKDSWAADVVDMKLINKRNKGFRFLLCVIDIDGKSASVAFFLIDKKVFSNANAFKKFKISLIANQPKYG